MTWRKWTEEEIEYVLSWYGKRAIGTISKNVGRSESAVKNKVYKLGLELKTNQAWVTLKDFCESTSLSRSSVQYWIDYRNFPARKVKNVSTKYLQVDPKHFWVWAAEHKHLIQWIDFPKYALGDEPKWVDEARKASRNRVNKRRAWSESEINELKYLLSKNKYTYPELSKRLNRSHGAIKRKVYDLQLPWPVYVNRKAVGEYTQTEIEKAVDLYAAGYPLAEVAEAIGRTEAGLRGKIERSGFKFIGKRLEKVN